MSTFLTTSLDAQTQLDMINRCLLAIGEVPLPDGTLVETLGLGTDGETASRIVRDTMIEVLSIGWYFNLDYNYKLYKDIDGYITLPANTLRVDTTDSNRYIDKGGRMYDTQTFSYNIPVTYIEADIVWLIDFPLLPPEAYNYIAARSARKFQEQVLGAPDLTNTTTVSEREAYTKLQRRQLQTRAYNIQNQRVSTRTNNASLRQGLYRTKDRY